MNHFCIVQIVVMVAVMIRSVRYEGGSDHDHLILLCMFNSTMLVASAV